MRMGNSFMERMMGQPESAQRAETGKEIAVIGIGLRFPLADNPSSFWDNAVNGREATRELPYARRMEAEQYTRARRMERDEWQFIRQGYLDRIDRFDYAFFGISPKEAEWMDPHQRLFLETAYHAFEDGGYTMDKLAGSKTGVFVGYDQEPYTYATRILEAAPRSYKEAHVGNLVSMIPGRVAHYFDLLGPSMIVNTSCSSSLVAVHTAIDAIQKGECELALAGGLRLDVWPIDLNGQVGIESTLGKTRTFDDRADGTVTGEGVCAVLLKPLQQARRDRDAIYAVIKGSAVNQDGHSIGLTAPNVLSQEKVIVEAWRQAGIDPETITYIEAHGTGTKLGDPIEIEAIRQAFSRFTRRKQFCAVSSVKPHVGHLIGCAGLAGFVRAALALQHRTIPPTLHCERPNRSIAFEDTAVFVNDIVRPWNVPKGVPRRCGVSSFGFSGTNCHIVLEEEPTAAETQPELSPPASPHVMTLSAKSQAALRRTVRQFAAWLSASAHESMEAICTTLHTARTHYDYRLVVIGLDAQDMLDRLGELASDPMDTIVPGAGLVVATEQIPDESLRSFCAAYARGEAVSWEALYEGRAYRRTRLPGYPFAPSRCWIQPAELPSVPLWEPAWIRLEQRAELEPSSWRRLAIHDGSEASLRIIRRLQAQSDSVAMAQIPQHDDYRTWSESLPLAELDQVVFLSGMAAADDSTESLVVRVENGVNHGLLPLLELCRTLARRIGRNPELAIVTQLGYAVTREEGDLRPEHRLLHTLGNAFPIECPNVVIRTVDGDAHTTDEQFVRELAGPMEKPTVALRRGERYAFAIRPLQDEAAGELPLRENGVYVLTGGGGAIAQEIAKYMSDQQRIHLAFISRHTAPSEQTQEMIRMAGSSVSLHRADIGSFDSVQTVLHDIRRAYGPIRGVIHCAGIASEAGTLLQKSNEAIRAVLHAKVYGTMYIDMATKQDEPDFFLCSSSIASHVGLASEIDYSLANAFLDAYCEERSLHTPGTSCLNWPAWHEQGMAVHAGGELASGVLHAISNTEAMDAFERVLQTGQSAVVIGKPSRSDESFMRLMARDIGLHAYMEQAEGDEARTAAVAEQHVAADITITLTGREAFTRTEQTVAQIWHEVLGYKQYDIEDQFFDIGGNSILMLKVHARVDEQYPGAVQLPDLFSYSTIAKLSAHIDSIWQEAGEDEQLDSSESHDDGELDRLIQQLSSGELSVDNAMSMLRKDRDGDAS